MNKSEIAVMLAMIAAFDQRTTGEVDIAAWQAVADVEHWAWPQVRRAVINFHRTKHSYRMQPADVVEELNTVRKAAARKLLKTDLTPPRHMADDVRAEITWRRNIARQVVDEAMEFWAVTGELPDSTSVELDEPHEPSSRPDAIKNIRKIADEKGLPE